MNIIQKIKLLFKLKSIYSQTVVDAKKEVVMADVTTGTTVVKPGWKTTEFWMTVIGNLVTVVGTLNGTIPPEKCAIIVSILNTIYTVLRTFAKK